MLLTHAYSASYCLIYWNFKLASSVKVVSSRRELLISYTQQFFWLSEILTVIFYSELFYWVYISVFPNYLLSLWRLSSLTVHLLLSIYLLIVLRFLSFFWILSYLFYFMNLFRYNYQCILSNLLELQRF